MADTIKLDDDVIVAIPDESVKIDGADKPDAAATKEPPARVSSLARARGKDADADRTRDVDERIATLEREREDARREAEAARAAAAAAAEAARAAVAGRTHAEETAVLREQQAMRAHVLRLQADKSQIEGAISATQSEAAMAQRELIQAIESGDAKRQAEAQHAIAKAEAALSRLEDGKFAADAELTKANRLFDDHEKARPARPADETVPEKKPDPASQPEPMTPDRWIETTAKNVLGDQGADWLRQNKQFATDPKMNRKFLRFADEYAEDHGQGALKSQDFLDALNDKFFPARDEDEPEPVVERPRSQAKATTAAPVSRGSNAFFSSRNLNASQVKLPPRLAAFVRDSGLNATDYALQCVADIKAGKLPKNYLDPDYDHGI